VESQIVTSRVASMFNPNNLVITGGHFVSNSRSQQKYGELKIGRFFESFLNVTCFLDADLKELFRNIVVDAFHNSSTSYDLAKCYPGTRDAVMKDLCYWVKNNDREHPIYHLQAPERRLSEESLLIPSVWELILAHANFRYLQFLLTLTPC